MYDGYRVDGGQGGKIRDLLSFLVVLRNI